MTINTGLATSTIVMLTQSSRNPVPRSFQKKSCPGTTRQMHNRCKEKVVKKYSVHRARRGRCRLTRASLPVNGHVSICVFRRGQRHPLHLFHTSGIQIDLNNFEEAFWCRCALPGLPSYTATFRWAKVPVAGSPEGFKLTTGIDGTSILFTIQMPL